VVAAATTVHTTAGMARAIGFLRDSTLIDGCLPSVACAGDVSGNVNRDNVTASQLQFAAGCGGTVANTCTTPIRLAVTRAAITLRDTIAPVPSNLRGSLLDPNAKSGTVNAVFDVADAGGGVFRTVTAVDNQVISVTPAAAGTCTDINPSNSNPYEFAGAVPCPLSQVALTSSIDTTKLSSPRSGWPDRVPYAKPLRSGSSTT
jgi:hypothetical protein